MCAPVSPGPRSALVARLWTAGCVFAEDEADLLLSAAGSADELMAMVKRRTAGWWHTGRADRRGWPVRSRAIRSAPTAGYHPQRPQAALDAGDPGRTGQCCSEPAGGGGVS